MSGKNIHIVKDNFSFVGKTIMLQNNEEAIIYGNNIGLKNGNKIKVYDENGCYIGIKNA